MMETKLTVEEVSKSLGISTTTVRRYINKGILPAVKVFNRYLVEQEDLLFALKQSTISVEEASDISNTSKNSLEQKISSKEPKYLVVKEVATLLKCSEKTIYRKVEERKIPSVKLWGKILFLESDIENFLFLAKKQEVKPMRV